MVQHESGLIIPTSATREPVLNIGQAVVDGRFQIQNVIALTGYADVYRATDWEQDSDVALKVIVSTPDEAAHIRARRELKAHELLNGKHGIIDIHGTGTIEETDEPYSYVAERFIAHGTLAGEVRRRPKDYALALHAGRQVIAGLRTMHSNGFVHCDIKPSNVLVDEDDSYLLTDFGTVETAVTSPQAAQVIQALGGLASQEMASEILYTKAGSKVYGTLGYMAPEVCYGDQPVDPKIDVFSTMITVSQLATGVLPYAAHWGVMLEQYVNAAELESPVPASRLNSLIPADFELLRREALRPNPDVRLTLDELDNGLQGLLANLAA